MFSRNRPTEPNEPVSTGPGKGHPTPSRKEAEAARRRPLVPVDRKAAAAAQRAATKEARDRQYQAMQTGDERYLPLRDKGPVRRWVRDYVDARRNVGELFLPISILMVVAMLIAGENVQAALAVVIALYLVVVVVVVDAMVLGRRLRRRLAERFGAAQIPRGTVWYGVVRSFQMRRMRMPKTQVGRGEYPA